LFRNLLLIACGSVLFIASSFATPTEDIARAVAVRGVSDVSQARPKQFLKAFTVVALRTEPRDLPDYVVAAVNLRPDLSPKIVAVAFKSAIRQLESKQRALCGISDRIVRAAIAANPDAAVSIAKAAVEASPALRQCVVAAAVSAAPNKETEIQTAAESQSVSLALLTLSGMDDTAFSISSATLNPANLSDLSGSVRVNSPEQPPAH
jgi:hypothetical protein